MNFSPVKSKAKVFFQPETSSLPINNQVYTTSATRNVIKARKIYFHLTCIQIDQYMLLQKCRNKKITSDYRIFLKECILQFVSSTRTSKVQRTNDTIRNDSNCNGEAETYHFTDKQKMS